MTWTRAQKHVVLASFLGWTLDAFDFFILVFLLKDIATQFHSSIPKVALAITLTLAMRPIGAFIFGRLADRFGRKPILMWDIALYSLLELLTAFSPNLITLLILRALFGIAMGGEWGIGAALTMETIPAKSRGIVSGLLQTGYPVGFLLASVVFGLFYNSIGWRGMFVVGALPALLILYIRSSIPESTAWQALKSQPKKTIFASLKQHWKLCCYAILLMTGFNFFSHGSQDLYPTFLQVQHQFDTHKISLLAIISNLGAIIGGLSFGTLSEWIGRRRAIFIAALLALPLLPLWMFSNSLVSLAIGAFLIQIAIQGAWGVVPAYLNEISPAEMRATFPGLVYQLGNFLASINAFLQAWIAVQYHGHYNYALALTVGVVAILIAILISFGPERRGVLIV